MGDEKTDCNFLGFEGLMVQVGVGILSIMSLFGNYSTFLQKEITL